MSQPPSPYDRQYNFTDFQSVNPTTPLPGQKVDQELNAVRSTLNATLSRLGEVQADDGKVRNSALNLTTIAEAVEPLLTTAPVQAVNAAGASQVAAVNAAGTIQVSAVNDAAAAGQALIAAETTTSNAVLILGAQQTAVIAAQEATAANTNAQIHRNLAIQAYQDASLARDDAQVAAMSAEGNAAAAANASSSAGSSAAIAVSEAYAANQNQILAEANMMAALSAKSEAEAAASQANALIANASSEIANNVQPYIDAADASASSASVSASSALASQSAAATSAASAASSASSASSSATSAANSAATINPANFAAAVHTHTIAQVTNLQTTLNGKANNLHFHSIGDVNDLSNQLSLKANLTSPAWYSYDQLSSVQSFHNGYLYVLLYNGSGGQVSFIDSLNTGSRIQFFQDPSAEQPIIFSTNVFNRENKLMTLGPRSQVTAVKTSYGWQIFGDLQFPPSGTLISSECAYWSGSDAISTFWEGNYIYRQTFADGNGSTYTSDSLGGGTCYLPYGYVIEAGITTSESTVSWSGCSSSGTATYSIGVGNLRADGYGSTYTETTGGWSAQYGDVIYDSYNGCVVKHDGMGGYFVEDNSGSGSYPSYGTYLGNVSGDLYIYYSNTGENFLAGSYSEDQYADGSGGVAYTENRYDSWYSYGTYIGYDNNSYLSVYSDGNGSYYTS
jgi:hypothetical protein